MTGEDCQRKYAEFLSDLSLFKTWAYAVVDCWVNSCEHNLTNPNMNRIAWMGQASVCLAYRIPSKYRGGYHLLTDKQQREADQTALDVINYWMFLHGHGAFTLKSIKSRTEANLY
jgi:hypothetical protein